MCYYRMTKMRSDAEQGRVDETLTTKDKAATVPAPVAVRSAAKDEACASFLARLQRWIEKRSREETTP